MKFTVEDRPAPGANPQRGYHANVTTVTFENPNQFDDWTKVWQARWVNAIAAGYKNEMWCHTSMVSPNVWEIHHGYDSGD